MDPQVDAAREVGAEDRGQGTGGDPAPHCVSVVLQGHEDLISPPRQEVL